MQSATATIPATAHVEPTAAPLSIPQDATIRVHPFRFDADLAVDVPLVRWPDSSGLRDDLARAGRACLLVVGPAERAPTRWLETEDWVRQSAPRAEFVTRATTVARRADRVARPCVERANVVSFRGRTVTVPRTQTALVSVLVHRFGATVADAEIRELCAQGGVSCHGEAVKTAVRRLKSTLGPLGLRLARVRSAGYVLDRRE